MHALVALLVAAGWRHAHAHDGFSADVIDRTLSVVFGDKISKCPHHRMVECAQSAGPATCLSGFGLYRAERELDANGQPRSFEEDLKQFPWEKYTNVTEEALESKLCDSAARLLQRRSLTTTTIPGYRLELDSKKNGTLSVDIYRNKDESEGRGALKKLRKRFMMYLPLLLLPGLLMSAILPFFLPGLKMLTIAAGMLNNMALTGAVFTLLRNNAFNDNYKKKVIYVNAGYKNEKHRPIPIQVGEEDVIHTHTIESDGYYLAPNQDVYDYAASDGYVRVQEPPSEYLAQNSDASSNGMTNDEFSPVMVGNMRRVAAKERPHPFEGFDQK